MNLKQFIELIEADGEPIDVTDYSKIVREEIKAGTEAAVRLYDTLSNPRLDPRALDKINATIINSKYVSVIHRELSAASKQSNFKRTHSNELVAFLQIYAEASTRLESLTNEVFHELDNVSPVLPEAIPMNVGVYLYLAAGIQNISNMPMKIMTNIFNIIMEDGKEVDMTPAARKILEDSLGLYVMLLRLAYEDGSSLLDKIERLGNLPIVDHTLNSRATDINKSKMGFISIRYNPFYFVRMLFAQWGVNRIRRVEQEKRLIEAKLKQLRESLNGESHPATEKAIAYYQSEVDKMDARIAKAEGR